MKRKNLFITLFFVSSLIAQEYIDIVFLKNGDVLKGKIIENVINSHIRIELKGGSILSYEYSQIESVQVEKVAKRTFGSGKKISEPINITSSFRDCYKDGYHSGQSIGGSGQIFSGFLGGFTLGLIGWGISYAVVSNGSPKPPYQETEALNGDCRVDYQAGYREGALKVKKSSVNIGGLIGTLTIINLLYVGY